MPGLPRSLRLAKVLGMPLERFAEGVEDPAGRGLKPTTRIPRRPPKEK
jgi:hypothetical protein